VKAAGLDGVISFEKEDALHLSYADNTFDAVTADVWYSQLSRP